ncbi:sterol desaturase family protein [Oceanibacterium hippocampi]|uniref:Fatty acid hydroxylase superfamily protein n=1 Tax=Oceanibacterium hippocampi TaxID=745714 RepID=A0A1Y5R921_9PROT|nr:sterol desaturase family protein [Oceanibacterium hippocampi]SLN11989.1 Fatty acid hydroxylase superfamily protein [Oceanibacterium hippocampi]
MDYLIAHEASIRLSAFAGIFLVMALWEIAAPKRALVAGKALRWFGNIGISVLNTLILRFLFPLLAVGLALLAEERGFGLFNWLGLPDWLAIPLAVILLDLVIYWQHVAFHHVPLLWRMHRMHHADLDIDVTTGARFHPLEIALSMLLKLAVVAALGAPAVSVILFEVILSGMAMFNHSNVRMPTLLDRSLRLLVVTPDMHRVHHSIHRDEHDSNFGFNLSCWDRLFGSYRVAPRDGHEGMTIGLRAYQAVRRQTLPWMLWLPFGPLRPGSGEDG